MNPYQILVVDDDIEILDIVDKQLEQDGFKVKTVASGEAALDEIERRQYDIVLTDLVMGAVDGPTVLSKVKNLYPDTPVIILTGHGDIHAASQAIRPGVDDLLIKPFDLKELSFRVDQCLEMLVGKRRMRQSEKALRNSERFLQKILDALQSNIAIIDQKGIILTVNAAWRLFAQQNGMTWKNYGIGANYFDACLNATDYGQEQAETVRNGIFKVLAGETDTFYLEYPCHSPNEKRWFEMHVSRFIELESSRLVISHRNITKQKLSQESLKQSEAQFRALVEFSSDHIFMLDFQGTYLFSNNRVARFQTSKGTLLGRKLEDLYPRSVVRVYRKQLKKVIESGRSVIFEHLMPQKHDTHHHVDTLYPIFSGKRLIAVGGISRDQTKQKKLEQQLFQAQKIESLGTLVAGVAHEINNPINLIMFNLPLLERIWEDIKPILNETYQTSPQRKYGGLTFDFLKEHLNQLLADMDLAANRVADIVKALKNFSKSTSSTEKTSISLNTAVRNAINLISTTVRKSGIELDLALDDNLPNISGNVQNLEQIIVNLSINSIQAIEQGHGRIRIATHYDDGDELVVLMVSDNGKGIDPQVADNIFDPFVTNRQAKGGTGLGLSVTYSLIRAHNGEISFTSQPDQGTTFWVKFPLRPKSEPYRILIVDDEAPVCKLITKILSQDFACKIEQAPNGTEALIKLGVFKPDLLILDLMMPEVDGLEVCRTITTDPELAGIKVMIVTGYPQDDRIKQLKDLGFKNIHAKPLDMFKFRQDVQKMLSGE